MIEIKFACPHCAQHVACDRDYADMCIVCPACGQPMEVPRLSAAEQLHPDICVVASTPQPKQRFASRIPTIDLWKEDEWEERYQAAATAPEQTPAWALSALGTLIVAALLKAAMLPFWEIALCVLAGTFLSCWLLAKGQTVAASPHSGRGDAFSAVVHIVLLLLVIPLVALGLLFVGCVVCARPGCG